MGICYELMMQDDFNWEYEETCKKKLLEKFEKEFTNGKFNIGIICHWYGRVIYDLDKINPEIEPYKSIILKNCDSAYYWKDSEPWEVYKLSTLDK